MMDTLTLEDRLNSMHMAHPLPSMTRFQPITYDQTHPGHRVRFATKTAPRRCAPAVVTAPIYCAPPDTLTQRSVS